METQTFTPEQSIELLRWAEFLTTTKLQRGHGLLRRSSNTFCCLGAYCYMKNKFLYALDNSNVWRYYMCQESYAGRLPPYYLDRLGLSDDIQDLFIKLNDDFLYSFVQIATEIKHLVTYGDFTDTTQRRLGL